MHASLYGTADGKDGLAVIEVDEVGRLVGYADVNGVAYQDGRHAFIII